MLNAPRLDGIDPFAATVRGLTVPDPVHAALRAAGPLVQVDAPAGGPAWIVTDDALAREVLADPRIVKDPACAPPGWDRRTAGLEPTAAEQPSLTTLDGPEHAALRRAHAPLLNAKRIRAQSDRVHAIARELLTELAAERTVVDLMAAFTTRYPLTVLLDLLGIPLGEVDRAADACRRMLGNQPGEQKRAIDALTALAASGLGDDGRGLAAELRDRAPAHTTRDQLRYHLFALIFAGQLTTDAALGTLIARALADGPRPAPSDEGGRDALVDETLRQHPPAPFTLWRFTTTELSLAGIRLPARAPVLVDILGINTDPARSPGPGLTFGAGPHFCIGAPLARLELRAVVTVLRTGFPEARLAVPFGELRQATIGGLQGSRLTALPVALHG
ncbi:cytochrome P450 [Streptomyces decoyicus]|uniref:cytochrome P450 n=1 Tax=Streptomyces decoyicus TaxID=249567 RepID=UPI0004AB9E24|nr:cytochrome P450 [Streptomyces decoyicus]KOG40546.1 cytochrome P450 [Streptomyces decoyicus]QZY17864.1 cytochrome P450 [Streptomyces decoyicus]